MKQDAIIMAMEAVKSVAIAYSIIVSIAMGLIII